MEELKINWVKRNLVYSAVRMGGGFVWRKHTKKSIENAKAYIRIVEIEIKHVDEEKPEVIECLLK